MRRRLLQLTAGVLLVGLALGLTGPAQAARPVLSGVVTGHPDGSLLAGIRVCAENRSTSVCATTGPDGRYRITAPSGTYRVTASDPYLNGDWVDQRWAGGSLVLDRDRRADIVMRPGARVDLRLRTRDGSPMPEFVSVEAYRVGTDGRLTYANLLGNASATEDRGWAEVAKIPPGRYAFRVVSGDGGRNVAESWHPFTGSSAAAQRFTISEGARVTVDPVEVGPPSTLVVASTGPKGRALASEVELFDAAGMPVWGHPETRGNRTTFHGLAPGRYRIRHTERDRTQGYLQWHPSGGTRAKARDVVVGEGVDQRVTTRLTYPSMRATTRPRLVRDLNTVTIKHGRWSPKPTRYSYEWYVSGRKKSNTWRDYTFMKDSSKGKTVRACVTAYRAKYATTRVCTKTIRLPRGDW